MSVRPDIAKPAAPQSQRIIHDVRPARAAYRPARLRRRKFKRGFKLFMLAMLLLITGLPALFIIKPWHDDGGGSGAAAVPRQSVEELAAITTNEQPVVLFVTDKSKVSQPFLEAADNGDEVRLYYQAKKAVLYRPSSGQVIATGDFTPPAAKVFLRAGTNTAARVKDAEAKLKLSAGINLVSKDKSSNTGYAGTLVVDISGRYKDQAALLAKALGATMSALPKGETAPDADILVIAGAK